MQGPMASQSGHPHREPPVGFIASSNRAGQLISEFMNQAPGLKELMCGHIWPTPGRAGHFVWLRQGCPPRSAAEGTTEMLPDEVSARSPGFNRVLRPTRMLGAIC